MAQLEANTSSHQDTNNLSPAIAVDLAALERQLGYLDQCKVDGVQPTYTGMLLAAVRPQPQVVIFEEKQLR